MPNHPPSTDERASLAQPSQSSSPLECTSHLGFSLVAELDRGENVTFTGTVESANRGKDRMGRARLKGCRATEGERR